MQEIAYIDAINLGFERKDHCDAVFAKLYGFELFTVEKKISKQIYLTWDCNTRKVTMLRIDKDGNIKGRMQIVSLNHLVEVMLFYGVINHEDHGEIIAKSLLT